MSTSTGAHGPNSQTGADNPHPTVNCPHCGTTFPVGAPAVRAAATPTAGLPDGELLRVPLARVLRLVLEVVDGRRVVRQLAGTASPTVLRYVGAMATGRRPGRVGRLQSIRVCRPTEGAAEAAAVVLLDQRVRAIAARFERDGDAEWCCVALRIL